MNGENRSKIHADARTGEISQNYTHLLLIRILLIEQYSTQPSLELGFYLLGRIYWTPNRKIGCNFSSVDLSMVNPYTNGQLSLRAFQKCIVLLCSDEYNESYSCTDDFQVRCQVTPSQQVHRLYWLDWPHKCKSQSETDSTVVSPRWLR